jgi:hypothetical protein
MAKRMKKRNEEMKLKKAEGKIGRSGRDEISKEAKGIFGKSSQEKSIGLGPN